MTKELEPCPFCGERPSIGLCGNRLMHDCKSLGAFISCTPEAWNTRYERTCHMERFDPYVQGLKCSECGTEFDPVIDTIDSSLHSPFKFCPNCGAEVADGD